MIKWPTTEECKYSGLDCQSKTVKIAQTVSNKGLLYLDRKVIQMRGYKRIPDQHILRYLHQVLLYLHRKEDIKD